MLGDIVDSQPVYVQAPFANYQDAGYARVQGGQRRPHADALRRRQRRHAARVLRRRATSLDPQRGQEAWAVIPSAVLPNLYKLADDNYKRDGHQFYVDGTPVGRRRLRRQRRGRRSWSAASTPAARATTRSTSPTPGGADGAVGVQAGLGDLPAPAPRGRGGQHRRLQPRPDLRQADHHQARRHLGGHGHLGLQQRQRASTGDGGGYLYVLNALTGKINHKIATGAGDVAATPSGLAQINNYVDNVAGRQHHAARLRRRPARQHLALRLPAARRLGDAARHGQGRVEQRAQPITDPARARRAQRQADSSSSAPASCSAASDVADTQMQSVYGIERSADGRRPDLPGSAAQLAAADADRRRPARRRRDADHRLHRHRRRVRSHRPAGCSICPKRASGSTSR